MQARLLHTVTLDSVFRGLLAVLLATSFASARAASQGSTPTAGDDRIEFARDTERVWIGPEFHANRLLDWRLSEGRVECLESSPARPMRSLHCLVLSLSERPQPFRIEVRTGALDDGPGERESWSGFLIGIGGEHVDPRLSALVHHWPGQDGGLFVGADSRGRPRMLDNESEAGPRGVGRKYPDEVWPLLAPDSVAADERPAGESEVLPGQRRLVLQGAPAGAEHYRLSLEVVGGVEGGPKVRATASWEAIPASKLAGGIALVSHGGGAKGGWWFDDWRIEGPKVDAHAERAFGPVLGTLYTSAGGILKLTAQFGPLGVSDSRQAWLETHTDGEWREVARGKYREGSATVGFRVQDWSPDSDVRYRVRYDLRRSAQQREETAYEGLVRAEPRGRPVVMGALSCVDISSAGKLHWNGNHFWFPHAELVAALGYHNPDLLFFAGDQIYEGGLEGVVRQPFERSRLDYLNHWYRWVWAFRDLTRDRPTICLPDDHDVYHGNIWGAAGERAEPDPRFRFDGDRGGYRMPPEFVNVVHETQTSHLPDAVDLEPLSNGISVYFTRLDWPGLSFAILADRMWKSAPAVVLPQARIENGWSQATDFDAAQEADVEGAVLLGARQLAFLERWSAEESSARRLNVVLSQTIFHNVATLPGEAASGAVLPRLEYPAPGEWVEGDRFAADFDSNGWPQSGRNRALTLMKRAHAFHVAGDQHLPSFTRYGIEDFGDAGFAFCVPATANLWPRRWFPPEPDEQRRAGDPAYCGRFRDGFGNPMIVMAVANPMRSGVPPTALNDRNPGYGILRFDPAAGTITSECWPRWVDPSAPDARQFPGWPIQVKPRED